MDYSYPRFDELVGDVDEFFKSYFGKRPLLRKGALSSDKSRLLTFADLDDLLQSEAIRPPHLRVTRSGMTVRESTYTGTARVQDEHVLQTPNPRLVMEHLRLGATVTWNSMNQYVPRLRALGTEIGTAFATRSDVVAFVTPAGQPGFAPHYDPTDVIVIQVDGTKAWKVWQPPEDYVLPDGPRVDITELGSPVIDTVLEPGDVLYVPHGRPHVAVCEDTMSLHLSCTIRPRTWSDMVQAVVADIAGSEESWEEFPALAWSESAQLEEHLQTKLAELVTRLARVDARSQLDQFRAEGTRVEGIGRSEYMQAVARIDHIDEAAVVGVPEDCVILAADSQDDDKVSIRTKGNTLQLPGALRPVLEGLRDGGPREVRHLSEGVSEDKLLEQAKKLVRAGVLEMV